MGPQVLLFSGSNLTAPLTPMFWYSAVGEFVKSPSDQVGREVGRDRGTAEGRDEGQ